MSESAWGDEPVEQKVTAKGGVPGWVWGCGGGCLVLLVLGIVGAIYLGGKVAEQVQMAMDPEVQWPRIAEAMPFEERPHGYTAFGIPFVGMAPGIEWMVMLVADPASAIVFSFTDADSTNVDTMFEPGFDASSMGFGGWGDPEIGTIVIQGRETRCVRFWAKSGGEMFGQQPQAGSLTGGSMMIDLSGNGEPVIVQISDSHVRKGEQIADETVRAFLAPFDAWGSRVPESEKERDVEAGAAVDADVLWARVAQVMPHGERPPGLVAFDLPADPASSIDWSLVLYGEEAEIAVGLAAFEDERELEGLFAPVVPPRFHGLATPQEPEAGTIEIQGRETRAVRFFSERSPFLATIPGETEPAPRRPGIAVDLSQEGEPVVLFVLDLDPGAADAPIDDDLVRSFLEPFDVWGADDGDERER